MTELLTLALFGIGYAALMALFVSVAFIVFVDSGRDTDHD